MALPNRAPDWDWWRHVSKVTLHEAVALSLNIDPKRLHSAGAHALMAGKRFDEGPEFERRLALANRCLGDTLPGPANKVAMHYDDQPPVIRLPDFAKWALSVEWQVPAELARLATGDRERPSNTPNPGPNERLTLPEQVLLLAQVMPEDRARARLEKAFRFREVAYRPEFHVSYEDARIDWQTGVVVLRRLARQPFTPTLSAAEFDRHFVASRRRPFSVESQPIGGEPTIIEPARESAGSVDDDATTRSGFPGRPGKAKHLIHDEFQRRMKAEEALSNLADEAAALLDWLVEAHPTVSRPTKRTIENNIRDDHRRWRANDESDPPS